MKGDVPVGYIIAILLGIAVIGLLGYWLFSAGGKGSGELISTECRAKILAYCMEKELTGGKWDESASKVCNNAQPSQLCCKNYTVMPKGC